MKTLLSIVFGVSMFCLLPSKGMAVDEAKPALFTIISAQYGANETWSDVSDKVKAAVRDDALTINKAALDARFASLDEIDTLVTDALDDATAERFRESGVEVIIAAPSPKWHRRASRATRSLKGASHAR